ncbi:MAG: sensor histidine kinase, partial [Bacteroidota bacterium]
KPFYDQKGIAAVYEEMGYNYREMGADDKALKFSRKALEIFETLETLETPKPYKIIDVRIDLGEYFKDRGQFEIAWEEHEEVMKVFESIPDSSESKFYKDRQDRAEELRANIYLESGQINKALPIFKKLNRPNNFTNIGHYYRVSGDDIINKDFQAAQTLYKEAERYHTQSFVHHSTIKNYPRQVLDYWNLGGIHRRLGRFRASIDTLEKGISLAKKHKEGEKLAGMYRTLSDTYHYMGKEDSALLYYRIHKATSDSLNQSRNETITRLSEVHYDTERKEKEKVQAQQETELRSKQLLISLLGFLLVAGLCIFYFYRARSRKIRMEQQAEINSQIVVDLIQEQTIENLNSRIEGQEEERTRIARELHDQLGGTLAAVKFSLEGMENKMPMELIDSYRKTHKLLQSATDNTRTLSHQMKALHLEDLGLDDSLQQFCDALNGNGSLQVHFNRTRIAESHISPKAELQLYRVAQELLQNVIKHAHASEVFLQLTYEEDKLTLMLEDDGQGFDTKKVSSGMGMQNIQNRVAQIDGKLDFDSLIGQGTTVIIEVPTEKD